MWERRDKHTDVQRQTQTEGQRQKVETKRQRQRSFSPEVYKTLLVPFLLSPSPCLMGLGIPQFTLCISACLQHSQALFSGPHSYGCWHHPQPASPCVHSAASPPHLWRALCSVLLGFLHLIYSILFMYNIK